MDSTGVQDQELIMEDEFRGVESSPMQKPTHFSLLILLMQTNGFQITTLILPLNHINSTLSSF